MGDLGPMQSSARIVRSAPCVVGAPKQITLIDTSLVAHRYHSQERISSTTDHNAFSDWLWTVLIGDIDTGFTRSAGLCELPRLISYCTIEKTVKDYYGTSRRKRKVFSTEITPFVQLPGGINIRCLIISRRPRGLPTAWYKGSMLMDYFAPSAGIMLRCSLHWHIPRLRIHCSASMSPRLIFRRYTEIRREDALSSPKSSGLSGGPLAAAIVLPVVFGSLLVVFTVLWYRRAQRRRVAEHDSAHAQQPVSADADAPHRVCRGPTQFPTAPTTPTFKKSAPAGTTLAPAIPPRAHAHQLTGPRGPAKRWLGGTRGSGGSRADPVLPRIQVPPTPQLLFNSD
ncbi:hypothetical protein BJY52DRAFT_392305 [Lactarius psammicola]|nr:hypothetical protein BJY52DRAFT_392305 [Lactarius psammicola]